MNVTDDQLRTLTELAEELDRVVLLTLLNTPAASLLKRVQRALPGLSEKIKAWVEDIRSDNPWGGQPSPWKEEP